jgi:hypothetical protein
LLIVCDPTGVQLALIIVVSCSLGLILLIVPFDKVVRTDGTKGEEKVKSSLIIMRFD